MAKPAGLFFQLCVQVLSLSLLGLASCSPKSESSSEKDPPNTIGPDGGTITLQEPDSPLDGMTIDVPNGAYEAKTTFKISSQPYNGEQTGILTPLTPLIHIDNGRRFAKKSITVTIPIALPDGMFAMGFFVNEDGKFEPMPVVALSEKSITVATRHFSEFLIGAISELELPDKIRTNFKPGVDDWQFENHG